MKTKTIQVVVITTSLAFSSNAQIITQTIDEDYSHRLEFLNRVGHANIKGNNKLSNEQQEALEFLYAYMPLPDIVDYSTDFFIENVDYALKARKEMPWGKIVPDKEFRHFVLPIRVNNENLDGHRKIFYEELKDRVKNLSMADAILEINHWCHEKATYQPSDSRTHSPLATCYTAIGRCGEESTFTVAALRAMGIPARQIYTPRWAHTDDNHAWVEAWADGKWYFLGACEPEPVLNLGWFNAPASRGMLMTTRVFGNYNGDEEILSRQDGYTNINVTSNYAPTDSIGVTVTDNNGKPLKDVTVSFRIYNYAEFYALATKQTDVNGHTSLTSGLGDIIIWATDGINFGYKKVSVGKDKNITLAINNSNSGEYLNNFDIIPPAQSNNHVSVTDKQVIENNARKASEDAIRGKYTSTFITEEKSAKYADSLGLDKDRLTKVLTDARGNYHVILNFLSSVKTDDRNRALSLVESISEKDRSDITKEILNDHIKANIINSDLYNEYILNPRVDVEFLSEYRSYFISKYGNLTDKYQKDPLLLVNDIAKNISIVSDWYPTTVRMSPIEVDKTKIANKASRNVYFVAVARSLGIPSRVDPITGKTQFADANNNWIDVNFDADEISNTISKQGKLTLNFEKTGRINDPKYYTNFTISKIENGSPALYEYPEDVVWSKIFKDGDMLDEGQYLLVTGQRMANGGVLAHTDIFQVKSDSTTTRDLIIRQDNKSVQVIGNFNAENLYHDNATNTDKSIISTTGRGYYILGLLTPNQEPSNHALRDIAALKSEFEQWGKSIVLLFKNEEEALRFNQAELPGMPKTAIYGTDINGTIASEITDALNLQTNNRPLFIIADTFNRIVYVSQGYTIGLGEQMIDIIHKLSD